MSPSDEKHYISYLLIVQICSTSFLSLLHLNFAFTWIGLDARRENFKCLSHLLILTSRSNHLVNGHSIYQKKILSHWRLIAGLLDLSRLVSFEEGWCTYISSSPYYLPLIILPFSDTLFFISHFSFLFPNLF